VNINLVAVAAEAGSTLQATFVVDGGTDPASPPTPPADGSPRTGSAQIALLAPPDDTPLSGPGADTGYARVNARAVMSAPSGIVSLDLVEFVDAESDSCSIYGTAVAA
jgi:hypothetical protein